MSNLDAAYMAITTTLYLYVTFHMPAAYRDHRKKEGQRLPKKESISICLLVYLIAILVIHIVCTAGYIGVRWYLGV